MSEELSAGAVPVAAPVEDAKLAAAKTITTVVYALQAVSILIGLTFIAAIIVNYVKKGDVEGTWLASHFRWQMRTFWFSLLWTLIAVVTMLIVVGYFIMLANVVWVIYRVVRGWLALNEGKPMYAQA